jgi:hypothetical protein
MLGADAVADVANMSGVGPAAKVGAQQVPAREPASDLLHSWVCADGPPIADGRAKMPPT